MTRAGAATGITRARPMLLSRRAFSWLGWAGAAAAFGVLAGSIVWILGFVLVRGMSSLSLSLFTTVTQGSGGGLLNAIEGTAVLAVGTLILAVPVGLSAGIYCAEFRHRRWAQIIRFLSDVLVGVPSIVVGYVGYVTLVEGLGWHFSVAAGSIALAVFCLPYICRTTEMALRQVPDELREAAYALGAGERRVILRIILPAAGPAVLTGILLALAISVGETAPLLYTAGWSNYMWDGRLTHSPIGYLTYAIWTFINEPFAAANALAYAAALLVTLFVLIVSIIARLLLRRSQF
ncbi:phosphate ABC transporter permease [Defluviimonas sp. 20V17]|uniref:Phosphate transport system permease protein PstA n=1 Tax=Allgaiera indica TaxID=765699 RepID=A0AAN4UTU8_9RHOB|nr:phosphate ABC transporter permease PstA [Allgaiera indica]KDB04631.1 phosphate ABC transporter permease [Defluviimonas sp. 20V17]GHE03700.1 phosphate transport system permease protein PstA 2 [Allgaiera indica]SDX74237.1 phosphate ABC transporter membrane protein 2, PhoT family [Allgaiera indica]